MKATRYKLYYPLEDGEFLLINTLTGAIDIVNKEVIRYITNIDSGIIKDLDEEVATVLKNRGYLVEENKDLELLNKMINYYEKMNNVLSFTICPTYLCNLRCPYCFENINIKKQEKVITRNDVDKIFECINLVSSKKNIKNKKIQIFGGEPFQLITKHIIEYILGKAMENNCEVVVITNGTNLKLFKKILSDNKGIISYVQITLDGPKEVHDITRVSKDNTGSFDIISENIQMLLDMNINTVVRVNIGKRNIKLLKELFEFYESKSWIKYENFITQLTPITNHRSLRNDANWMPESEILKEINDLFGDIESIRSKYKVVLGTDIERRTKLIRNIFNDEKKPYSYKKSINPCACGAGSRIYYVFGADGMIYPCPETVGDEKYSIGSYLPDINIKEDIDNKWKRNVLNIKKCRDCNIAPLCGAGCTWSSIATNGVEFEEPVCNYAKETIDSYFEINKNKIMKKIKGICNG